MAGKPRAGPTGPAAVLMRANQQISVLYDKTLPNIPHLFSVPTTDPPIKKDDFPNENKRTPFGTLDEVRSLQYMTLISNGDRGVGSTRGNLEDLTSAGSPLSTGSQNGTPNGVRETKTPKVKLSISDYKNFKTTGVKPSPKTATPTFPESKPKETVDRKLMHSRNTSATSVTIPMTRLSSFEGSDPKPNGASGGTNSRRVERPTVKGDKPDAPRSVPSTSKPVDKPYSGVNGREKRESLPANDAHKHTRPDMQRYEPDPSKREPRPRSPQRNATEAKQTKRPLDSSDATPAEKRARTEPRTTPSSQKGVTKKPDTPEAKNSISRSQKPVPAPSRASPLKKAAPTSARPSDIKANNPKPSKIETTLGHIPPLLSPLPADLTAPAHTNFGTRKSEPVKGQNTPSQKSKPSTDISPAKQSLAHLKDTMSSSPLSTPPKSSPPFVLPRMLSPGLPDIVEAELDRLQKKVTPAVESRPEKVSKPVAPEVTRPKIGHPPKKVQSASTTPKVLATEEKEKLSLIVKIKYKRRLRIDIERILRLQPKLTPEFKELERRRVAAEKSNAAQGKDSGSEEEVPLARKPGSKKPAATTARKQLAPSKFDSDDSDSGGAPLATKRNSKAPETTAAKKRPINSSSRPEPNKPTDAMAPKKRAADFSDRNEPAQKRPKAEERPAAKASTPLAPGFKSPTVVGSTAARDKALLSTPSRGDSMRKSVAMSKVASSDGHAKTPQASAITSNPTSAEKPRANNIRGSEQQQRFFNLGTNFKRAMQRHFEQASRKDDNETKLAVMGGVEGLMAYMVSKHIQTRVGPRSQGDPWNDLFPIFNFVERCAGQFKELNILVCNLGAVAREQSIKVCLDNLKDTRVHPLLVSSHKERDRMWGRCYDGERNLKALVGDKPAILGPWSSVRDAVAFGVGVLEDFAAREGLVREGEASLMEVLSGQVELNPGVVINGSHSTNGVHSSANVAANLGASSSPGMDGMS